MPQAAIAIPVGSESADKEAISTCQFKKSGKIDLASIVRNSKCRKLTCFARKVSEKSAVLEFESDPLPKYFVLNLEHQSRHILCNRVWMQGQRCGVQFLDPDRDITWRF